MCEMPEVFHQLEVRANKEHRCCECGGTIYKGEKYEKNTGIWAGEWDTYHYKYNQDEDDPVWMGALFEHHALINSKNKPVPSSWELNTQARKRNKEKPEDEEWLTAI